MIIGILSMQKVLNHGSFLQSYGLMSIFNSFGYDIKFLDIEFGESNVDICVNSLRSGKKQRNYTINRLMNKYRDMKQNRLLCYYQEQYFKPATDNEIYDLVVIGSDEVFNCAQAAPWGFSKQLFGDISNSKRVVTYAASCGLTKYEMMNEHFNRIIRESMKNLYKISVRDKNTYSFVTHYADKQPEYHLDPVLIYDYDNELIKCKYGKPFILVYSYKNRFNKRDEIEKIKHFAKKNGLDIVCAGVFQYWCNNNIVVSPFELLGYFEAAKYIVTDTFHGTVISIKYNKQFATVIRDSNRNKLEDLLERCGLLDRKVDVTNELSNILLDEINYQPVNVFLKKEKLRTKSYLEKAVVEI